MVKKIPTKCEPVEVMEDGWSEWIHPVSNPELDRAYLLQCCDCSLIHEIEFQLNCDNELIFRARRIDDDQEDSRPDEGSQG